MEKRIIRSLILLLSLTTCVILICGNAFATSIKRAGTCGEDLSWTLDDNGELTITGTGDMTNWSYSNAPWNDSYSIYTEDIKKVIIQPGVSSIGDNAFSCCPNLTNVSMPNSIISIGDRAFSGCALTDLIIPDGVKYIGDDAFRFSDFTNIVVPESVNYIGDGAFSWCTNLTDIEVNSKNEEYCSINGVLYSKDKSMLLQFPAGRNIKSFAIPDGVTTVGTNSFSCCHISDSIAIPDSVSIIENESFEGGYMAHIKIPDSVSLVGYRAFGDCHKLTDVTVGSNVNNIGDEAFRYCYILKKITFRGKAPTFGKNPFIGVEAMAYYPLGADFWPVAILRDYGGLIVWNPTGPVDLSEYTVTLKKNKYVYDGKAKKPVPVVGYGDILLDKDIDYSVVYKNNTNAGTATISIIGNGDHTGSIKKSFTIIRADQSITAKSFTKTLGDKSFNIGAKTNGGGKLSYKTNNNKVATVNNKGKVTLVGTGKAVISITASKTTNYEASSKKITITVRKPSPPATSLLSLTNPKGKKLNVKWKKVTKVTGYEIQYSTSSKFDRAKISRIKSANSSNSIISKLTKKKKYFVRVRTYITVGSNKYCSKWSDMKSITVTK